MTYSEPEYVPKGARASDDAFTGVVAALAMLVFGLFTFGLGLFYYLPVGNGLAAALFVVIGVALSSLSIWLLCRKPN